MSNYITLYVSENSDECPCVFTLPEGVPAFTGNLLEHNGEVFPVKEIITICADSAEYRLISSICMIRKASAVYCCCWNSENG